MSEFSRNVDDYIDFYPSVIRDNYGDTALDAVMNEVKSQFDQLITQIEFAGSDEERDFAIEQLQDFQFSESEALSIAEDYELDFLENYMSQSYKYDMELIQRYVELTGGGYSQPSAPREPSPPREPTSPRRPSPPKDETEELEVIEEVEEFEELEETNDDFQLSFFDLLDTASDLAESIGSFFDEFF